MYDCHVINVHASVRNNNDVRMYVCTMYLDSLKAIYPLFMMFVLVHVYRSISE